MARIVIAGCGDVGTALGLVLNERGHDVVGVRRSAERVPATLQPRSVDLTDPVSIERGIPGVDIAVYCVAAGSRERDAYRRAYSDGVAALLGVLENRTEPPGHAFFVSSTSVYGERGGAWIDESSPVEPDGFGGECLVAGEQRMLDSPIPATVVRFAGIYGPGRGRLIEQARAGARCSDYPPKYTNRIHRDDCAGVLAHLVGLAARRESLDNQYIGVDDEPAAECEVVDWLAARLGAPPPRRTPSGDPTAGASGKRCSNARLRSTGYRFRYPTFRDGYAAVLARDGVRYG